MERTVGEVLPTVKANQEGIKQLLSQLAASKTDKEKAAAEWKVIFEFRRCSDSIAQLLLLFASLGVKMPLGETCLLSFRDGPRRFANISYAEYTLSSIF